MHSTTFILGGCRSGKSRHALEIAEKAAGRRNIFLATCIPRDEEMKARVRRHQLERGDKWQALEVPLELAPAIAEHGPAADLILIDCLTLWISNIILDHEQDEEVYRRIAELSDTLRKPPCPIILVSNEVGMGIVPENALARRFRDLVGRANQEVAAACGQVIWMVAGIPFTVKPNQLINQ